MKRKIKTGKPIPGFMESQEQMDPAGRIFVDKSMAIGHYLQLLLKDQGLRQKDLAEALGKTEAEISKWLSGMHNYTLRTLSKLEAALGEVIVFVPEKHGQTDFSKEETAKKPTLQINASQREEPTAVLDWEGPQTSTAVDKEDTYEENNLEALSSAA